jgi:hypothetical protein
MNEYDFRQIAQLYHGSDVAVKCPDPFYSTIKKDFGQGFYVSIESRSAMLWARRVAFRNNVPHRKPTVNTFDFTFDDKLKCYFFDCDNNNELNTWIDYIVYNRDLFSFVKNPLASGFDIIVGLIANGEWADLFEPFERRVRTEKDYLKEKARLIEDLIEIEASRKLGYQCCMKTPLAVRCLKYNSRGSYYA